MNVLSVCGYDVRTVDTIGHNDGRTRAWNNNKQFNNQKVTTSFISDIIIQLL